MNALAALGITYLIITICSAGILYFSFNGKIDDSGKYFFLGELTIIPGIAGVVLGSLNPIFIAPPILFTINTFVWASHVYILFSIYALSRNTDSKKLVLAIFFGILYALLIEALRFGNTPIQTTTLLTSISDACFGFWTYVICRNTRDNELKKNLFF